MAAQRLTGLLRILNPLKLKNFVDLPVRRVHCTPNLEMKVVGLISGGKDSCFNLIKCIAEDHEIVALANLHPADPTKDELDSYMYQTVGHDLIEGAAQALSLPLYRRPLSGKSLSTGKYYEPRAGDEVEDLYELIKQVKEKEGIEAVSVGAVLSDYQRVRVESVCARLGLTCLGYLWSCDQTTLLNEMIDCGMEAVLVKVACIGLEPAKHLNKSLVSMREHLLKLRDEYGAHVCGEGGEYETITLDCPIYNSRIIIDEFEIVERDASDISPVGHLKVSKYHLQPKPEQVTSVSWRERVNKLPLRDSRTHAAEFLKTVPASDPLPFVKQELSSLSDSWPAQYETYTHKTDKELFCSLRANSTGDVFKDTEELMDRLGRILQENSMSSANLVYALLYVSDMSQFANINSVYSKFFGVNPPPRICVEAALPGGSLFHAQVLCSREPKETRHVQGVSHWAPSCIGPYSQASKVGDYVFVSGQIPLVPGSMKTLAAGFVGQCHFALHHALSVGESMGMAVEHMVSAHCYVSRQQDAVAALQVAQERGVPERVTPVCLVVPRLPRDVMAEWHVAFNTSLEPVQVSVASGDSITAAADALSRSLDPKSHYFLFYSAQDVDIQGLLSEVKEKCAAALVPVPVSGVVTDANQSGLKHQVVCCRVAGLSD